MNDKIKKIVKEYEEQDNSGSDYPYVVLVQELYYTWVTIGTFFTRKAAKEFMENISDRRLCIKSNSTNRPIRIYIECIKRKNSELRTVMDYIGLKDAFNRKMEKPES